MVIETKADFAAYLRKFLPAGTTIREAEKLADAYSGAVHEALAKGAETIRLPGIGTIKCDEVPSRTAVHPATGEAIEIGGRRRAKFKFHACIKRLAAETKSK